MTEYILGPRKGKAELIIRAGGIAMNGAPATLPPAGSVLVSVIDNGPFESAPIVQDETALRRFTDPDDGRPKQWFTISRNDLSALTGS